MIACKSTVVIVEGDADREAVPFLLRRVIEHEEFFDHGILERPILARDIPTVRREGELERFVQLACARAGCDSVLVLIDCDDDCARDVAFEFSKRLYDIAQGAGKKVGVGFFCREFEALFLGCISSLNEKYPELGFRLNDAPAPEDVEGIRDAKGRLARLMSSGTYKPTRDQARFVSALDFDNLVQHSRSFQHVRRLVEWLRQEKGGWTYPREI